MERLRREVESLRRALSSAEAGVPAASPRLEIPFDELDIRDQIGGGGFSVVYRAFWRGTPVAVKRWLDPDLNERVVSEFRAEVMTMQNLRHPHCVQLVGACSVRPNLCIVMEYVPSPSTASSPVPERQRRSQARPQLRRGRRARARLPPLAIAPRRAPRRQTRQLPRRSRVQGEALRLRTVLRARRDRRHAQLHGAGVAQRKTLQREGGRLRLRLVLWETITREVPFDGMLPGDIKRAAGKRTNARRCP